MGVLVKTESHVHKVGTSERTKAVIEPRLSDQWFLKMEALAQPAINAVLKSDDIALFLKNLKILTAIGWKIFEIGIFQDNCGGDNEFQRTISAQVEDFVVALNSRGSIRS